MKSTIKIDYERSKDLSPVIKIIIPKLCNQPAETPRYNEATDEDVKDSLLRDFLHSPCMALPNRLFEVKTKFPINGELELTTIGAISEENLFSRFKWAIIHRLVPSDIITSGKGSAGDTWNKINDFFDWVEEQGYAPTPEVFSTGQDSPKPKSVKPKTCKHKFVSQDDSTICMNCGVTKEREF